MDELVHNLTGSEDVLIPLVIFLSCMITSIVAIVLGAVKRMVVSSNLEKSRREIAAYIAEGSMTTEDGERLLNAGKRHTRCG